MPSEFQFILSEYLRPTSNLKLACRRFSVDTIPPRHHGFHSFQSGKQDPQWRLFQETNRSLLHKCKPLILHMDYLYRAYAPKVWTKYRSKVPEGYGLFGSIWTTFVINFSSCSWHYDPRDRGFGALLYFGHFQGGELRLASPMDLDVPVQQKDIVFLLGSKIYHKAMPFTGRRTNLALYSSKIQKKTHAFLPNETEFRKK